MHSPVIVVGVDGSVGSHRALRWALDEAVLRGCAIEAVTVWRSRGENVDASPAAEAEQHREADELQRHVLDAVLAEMETAPPVAREVVRGEAIDVLLRRSAHAELLVVGSHGTTGLRHAALGSVSEACARMADCPSVVVPASAPTSDHTELAVVPETPAE